MKKTSCSLLCSAALLAIPISGLAADVSVDATTVLRYEQRDVTGTTKQTLLPATQFLGLDVDKLADGNLSLHLYGWGRADLADKSFNTETGDGSLSYGYLQYRFKQANASIRLGRTAVREGIINEQIDGLAARSDLPAGFGLSAFGGAVVHTRHLAGETSDGKGNSIFGGRASYRYNGLLELGLSGLYEGTAPTLVNPAHSNANHRLVGGDIWLTPHRMVELIGHSSYNPETKTVAEHSYLLTLKPLQGLAVSGEFNEQRSLAYLGAAALFTSSNRTTYDPAERSRTIGGNVAYQLSKNVELAADYKHYTRQFGSADRYGADTRLSFSDNSIRGGLGYHYLRAAQGFAISGTASASYHQLRGYLLHDTKGYFAALDAIGYLFKEKIYNEKSAWEGTASLGYHLTPALAVSGDISYSRNPEFTEETKGLLRLTYNMTFEGKGGNK